MGFGQQPVRNRYDTPPLYRDKADGRIRATESLEWTPDEETQTLMSAKGYRQRYAAIDCVRGSAVLLMIVFHFAYDLNGFGLVHINFSKDIFWFCLPRFIVTLFMLCVGMCLAIVHKGGVKWSAVRARLIRIGGWALVITVVTYIFFPSHFVFFGVLHCIAVASLLAVFFVNRPRLSLVLGLGLLATHLLFRPKFLLLSDWLDSIPMDYVPLYPWFGVVLVGVYLESRNLHEIKLKEGPLTGFIEFLGRHSLKIYLIHRPVLFGGIFLVYAWRSSA